MQYGTSWALQRAGIQTTISIGSTSWAMTTNLALFSSIIRVTSWIPKFTAVFFDGSLAFGFFFLSSACLVSLSFFSFALSGLYFPRNLKSSALVPFSRVRRNWLREDGTCDCYFDFTILLFLVYLPLHQQRWRTPQILPLKTRKPTMTIIKETINKNTNLKTSLQNSSLSLTDDVLWPSDESGNISLWRKIVTNGKVLWSADQQWVLAIISNWGLLGGSLGDSFRLWHFEVR